MSRFEKIIPSQKHELVRDPATGLTWPVEFSAKRLTFADAEKYVAELNTKKHCGFDDWRMPTLQELESIRDLSRINPAIDTDAFPNTPSDWFWTSTPYAGDPKNYAWVVGGYDGNSALTSRDGYHRVRAVRGPARQ